MKKMEKLIKQINNFSRIAKQRELTSQEKNERENLRNEYRLIFKAGFEQKLQTIKFVKGNKDN